MTTEPRTLRTLVFEGPRFQTEGLEIDVLPELVAYKKLLVETAKELWRERNPGRERLPKRFEENIRITIRKVQKGSVVVPLHRELVEDVPRLPLEIQDEIEEAAKVLDEGIQAASEDRALPAGFPKPILALFDDFGKTLGPDDSIQLKSQGRRRAVRYTPAVRERLIHWVDRMYEDEVEIAGEVRLADLDGRNFVLRADDGTKVSGKFTPDQETIITEGLREHATCRLVVRGRGEHAHEDGKLRRFLDVREILFESERESVEQDGALPVWEAIAEIGRMVPSAAWDAVPKDLAKNLDHYLYGSPKVEE